MLDEPIETKPATQGSVDTNAGGFFRSQGKNEQVDDLLQRIDGLRVERRFAEALRLLEEALKDWQESPPAAAVARGRLLIALYRPDDAAVTLHRAYDLHKDADVAAWLIASLSLCRRYGDAGRLAVDACEAFPRSVLVRVAAGRLLVDQYEFGKALSYFQEAYALDAGNPVGLVWLLHGLRRLRKYDEADTLATTSKLIHQKAQTEWVRSLLDRHQFERVLAELPVPEDESFDVAALQVRVEALRSLRKFEEAHLLLNNMIAGSSGDARPWVELGHLYDDLYDYESSLAAYEHALTIDPNNATALEWRITALRRLRRFTQAHNAAQDAINRRPDTPDLHIELGYIHNDQHDYEAALTAYEHALTIDPQHEWALTSRITALRRLRRFTQATNAAQDAINRRPDTPRLHIELGYIHDNQHDYEAALTAYEHALTIDPQHEWALTSRITALRRLRRFTQAHNAAQDAINRRPDTPRLHIALGYIHNDQHDYEAALTAYEHALTIDPNNATALEWRITALRQLRRFTQAHNAAQDAINRRPDTPRLHIALGYIHNDQHDHEAALTAYEHALTIDPNNTTALTWKITALRRLRRFTQAHNAAQDAINRRPDTPDLHIELGYIHNDQHDHEAALTAYEHALTIDPQHEWALTSRITALRRLRRFTQAHNAAQDAINRRPDTPDLHIALGIIHDDQHDYEAALTAYEHALTIDPNNATALEWRITALRQLRRFTQAHNAAQDAINRRPDTPDLHIELGYIHNDQHDYEAALTAYEHALTIDPQHEWALTSRITALRRLRRFTQAHNAAQDAINRRPDTPDLHIELGYIHNDQHDHEAALTAYEHALTIDPQHEWALTSRITALRRLRRFTQAHNAAQDAINRRPDTPDLHIELGYIHNDQHDHEAALTAYEHALTIDPQHEWALTSRITALRRLRRFTQAHNAAQDAINRRPDTPDLHIALGIIHDDQHDHEAALTAYEHALTIDPQHEWALTWKIATLCRLRRFTQAHNAAQDAINRRPDTPDLHIALGIIHDDQHDYEAALTAYEHALTIDPQHEWALTSRITALRRLRRFTQAHNAAQDAINRRPDTPDLHIALGYIHNNQHDYEAALTAYEHALTIDPNNATALEWRITALRQLRRFTQAHNAAQDAINRRPDTPDLHIELGYIHNDQHDYEAALTAYEHALTIDPQHEWALTSRITALRRLRRFTQATNAAQDAINRHSDTPELRLELASIAEGRGDYRGALVRVQEALTIDPYDEDALSAQIRIKRLLRDFAGALEAAQQAARVRPDSVDTLVELGQVYADQYDDQRALTIFDRAVAIDPGHTQAVEYRVTVLRRMRRYSDAEQCVREALTLRPAAELLHVCLGRVFEDRLQTQDALACYRDAGRYNPREPQVIAGQSAALRTLRSYAEAERLVAPMAQQQPYLRALVMELAWIQHDTDRLSQARASFTSLERSAESDHERAASITGLGWVEFACGDYVAAEEHFSRAVELVPYDREYRLANAWALVRQDKPAQWKSGEELCLGLLDEQQDAAVLVCLGVIDYRLGRLPAAEYHLTQAISIDPHKGSHTDLAALYAQLGRFDEADEHLRTALSQDPSNISALIEMGHLRLLADEAHEAVRNFRSVLRLAPSTQVAALGLAEALTKLGQTRDAEDVLREALRTAARPWRLHLALARLLFQQADTTHSDDIFAEAYAEAVKAIQDSPAGEPDPHYVAAICKMRLSGTAPAALSDARSRRHALRHLRRCLSIDNGHVDAQRLALLLERERRTARTTTLGTITVASVAIILLAVMWTAFFLSDRVTDVMITTITPILVGLVAIAVLLPSLIRLKLPGLEADLQAGLGQISSGPTGEVAIRPGNLAISIGPTGHTLNRQRIDERKRV
ncbi:tetratricopeptide repeat protein [Solwaraspora sp. WMMD792]|uniref:tetratricopeptide repeat protein n=1 Tax=Solwaraspora sp. WMMD792 TaxID=3016099 RepID=UPI002417EC59|nr:tetratricopeptide repeat protein [Solwaraspora sp. WMMD792]MDG4773344.1 tetratricopeptide repeat protein [Solwaraspora sp. WMMD792]